MHKLIKKFTYGSIRARIMSMMVLVIILSILIFFFVVNVVVSQNYMMTILRSSSFSFSLGQKLIEQTISHMLDLADLMAYNKAIRNILTSYETLLPSVSEQYVDMREIRTVIQSQTLSDQSIEVKLYIDKDLVYLDDSSYFGRMSDLDSAQAQALLESNDNSIWIQRYVENANIHDDSMLKTRKIISVLRKIQSYNDLTQTTAVVSVSIESSYLDEVIAKTNITEDGFVVVINSNQEIISSSNLDEAEILNLQVPEIYQSMVNKSGDWSRFTLESKQYLFESEAIEGTDWYLIFFVPESDIYQPAKEATFVMLLVMLAVIVLGYISSFLLASKFSLRLRVLSERMIAVRSGKLKPIDINRDSDEIAMLYESFNYMVNAMKSYINKQKTDGIALRNAEVRALQEQINPHFLYNTLDLINWRAIQSGDQDIARIAQALARYYRLSLNSGKEIVSIEEELKHVETYVQIQNFRFRDRIHFAMTVPDELLKYEMPKMILQPLVENAILHGIMANDHVVDGRISIDVSLDENDVILSVSDNGIGMSRTQISSILSESKPETYFAVYNTNRRLVLLYGERYGLSYESVLGQGTKVTIRIPAQPVESGASG